MNGEKTILLNRPRAAGLITLIALQMSIAIAQTDSRGPANALQGFSKNCNKPVRIEADTLEVRDKEKVATFLGNVRLVQGDTMLRSKTLVVYYVQSATDSAAPPSPTAGAGGEQQRIRRIEAKGGVIITQKGQTATGKTAIFDVTSNTAELRGSVILTQDRNVVRGDRLVVDLTTGVSRVESSKAGGAVHALIQPESPGEKTSSDIEKHAANSSPKSHQGVPPSEHSPLC